MNYNLTYKIQEDATFDVLFNENKIGKLIQKDGYWWFKCNRQLKYHHESSVISILEKDLTKSKDTFVKKLNCVIDFYKTLTP